MSFYTADGLSAQAGINWSPHQQTWTNPHSPTTVRATSNSSCYTAPLTPTRSIVPGQPVLQYTIERQQLERPPSDQHPEPNLQFPINAPAVTCGESYAQRLYASSFSEQFKVQTQQQPSSSGLGECPGNQVPAAPRAPYDARASLLPNTGHNDDPQTASALDFYYGTVSKLDLESLVPDPGTNSPGAPRPQSATGSAPSMAHYSVPIEAAHVLQSSTRRSPVTVDISDGPPPSPAADPRRSSQVGLHSRSLSSTMHMIPGRSTSSDLPLRPESVNNVIASPVPPEASPRVFSPYSEDYPTGPAYVAVTTSNFESMTPPSDPLPASTQIESLDVGGSEEVPLYSLVDEEPPPPDFDESQSMCGMTKASMYYAESPIVLAPPDVSSPRGSDAVSGAVPSSSADTPSFIGAPHTLSPAPLLGSPRTSLAMPDVMSYPTGRVPEDVKEKLYGYFAEDLMPDKSSSHPSMEAPSSSRTQFQQVVSNRQPRYNIVPQEIPHPPISPAVSPRNDASAEAFSTAPLPALPPRRPVAASPAPITTALPTLPSRRPGTSTPASITAAPLRALSPRHPVPSTSAPITAAPLPAPPPRHPALPPRRPALPSRRPVASTPVSAVTFTPSPMMPARPHTLNPRSSNMNPGNFRPAASLPLRPGSNHQPTRLPLPPGVRRGPTFPPSSAGTVASTPAPVTASTPSPAMLARPHTLNSSHPVNFGAASLPSRPGSSHQPMHLPLPPGVRAGPTFPPSSVGSVASTSAPVTAFTPSPAMPARPHTLKPRHPVNFRPATSLPLRPGSSHQPTHLPLPPRVRAGPTSPPSSAGISPFITTSTRITSQTSTLPSRPFSQHSQGPSASSILSTDGRYAESMPQLSPHVSPTRQGQVPYQSTPESFQPQASWPLHPQHARALTTPAKLVHSSRGLGKNIAAGVLGLLGGAVLAEAAGDDDIVDDITEIMDDMSIGNSADDQFDPDMDTNNNQGSGSDSTDIQGDQTSPGDASNVTDYQGDQTFTEDFFDPTANIQVDQTFSGVSFDAQYYQGDQIFTEDFFDPMVNVQVDQTFDGVSFDAPYYQGDLIVTEDFYDPTANIQVDQMFDGVSFDAPYYQGDLIVTEDFYDPTASIQVDQTFDGVSFDAPYYQGDQLFTGDPVGQTWVVSDQTIGTGLDPNQSQGYYYTSPQSSHTSHTQNPHMNHGAHPSFGTAGHTTQSQGPPIPAHHAVNHGHGTAPHHAHSPQSQAGSSVPPAQHHAQGNSQQNQASQHNHTGQHHHSHHSHRHGLNKTMELVKDALITGSALATLVGNGNG